jgi:hypothetical protein
MLTDRVGFGKPSEGCGQVVVALLGSVSPILPPLVSSCNLGLSCADVPITLLFVLYPVCGDGLCLSSPFCDVAASSLGVSLLVQLLVFILLCPCCSLVLSSLWLPNSLLWLPSFLHWFPSFLLCLPSFRLCCRTSSFGVSLL